MARRHRPLRRRAGGRHRHPRRGRLRLATTGVQKSGNHALVWDTADTDPGQSTGNLLLLGDTIVTWSQDRVLSYRLSDGQRVWQQLLPSGAGYIVDVAASGPSVVVAYDDRLRALSATTGAQQWAVPGVTSSQLVVADGWVYTNNLSGVSRYALATGAAGWSLPNTDIYRIEAVDADTVYVWEAVFDFSRRTPRSCTRCARATARSAGRATCPRASARSRSPATWCG